MVLHISTYKSGVRYLCDANCEIQIHAIYAVNTFMRYVQRNSFRAMYYLSSKNKEKMKHTKCTLQVSHNLLGRSSLELFEKLKCKNGYPERWDAALSLCGG
jgi:hypothetical protein